MGVGYGGEEGGWEGSVGGKRRGRPLQLPSRLAYGARCSPSFFRISGDRLALNRFVRFVQ